MVSSFQALGFFQYKLHAVNQHALHSPFVYEFYTKVLKSNTHHPEFDLIDGVRSRLRRDVKEIKIMDFGAGSKVSKSKQRKVKDIAKSALSSRRFSSFMFKLCQFMQADNIVELGTSFGINTLYLSLANEKAKVRSFEGCPETVKIAEAIFKEVGLPNTQIIAGQIDDQLVDFLTTTSPIDLVYMDANHTYEATMNYFNLFLPHLSSKAVMVIDDIYWSKPMNNAWKSLLDRKEVTLSMDIYDAGLLFFDKGLSKEHFILDF